MGWFRILVPPAFSVSSTYFCMTTERFLSLKSHGTRREVFIAVKWILPLFLPPVISSPGTRRKSSLISPDNFTVAGSMNLLCSLRTRKLYPRSWYHWATTSGVESACPQRTVCTWVFPLYHFPARARVGKNRYINVWTFIDCKKCEMDLIEREFRG